MISIIFLIIGALAIRWKLQWFRKTLRELRLPAAEAAADLAIEKAWSGPIKLPPSLPPGTVEQELLKEFIAMERNVAARDQKNVWKRSDPYGPGYAKLQQDMLRQQLGQQRASNIEHLRSLAAQQQMTPHHFRNIFANCPTCGAPAGHPCR